MEAFSLRSGRDIHNELVLKGEGEGDLWVYPYLGNEVPTCTCTGAWGLGTCPHSS